MRLVRMLGASFDGLHMYFEWIKIAGMCLRVVLRELVWYMELDMMFKFAR